MRNLKRALSLAMASIMILGMMVIGAGAVNLDDFSDKDKIANAEAVTVLTTLGVIVGREDGTYDPEGTVTRGEMAKMICVILNGGKDPQLGETLKNTYTDTVGHWAAPYIEYCTTLGIVAGRNDGTFDPNGTVTVAEAGKMLLVALGYNASVEGYTGANWQINTDVRANQIGMYDELGTLNTNVALTRDNAAQICYNALDLKIVEYSYVITGSADNSISTKPQLNDQKHGTLLFEKFGAIKLTGVVVANEFANLNGKKTDADKAPTSVSIGSSLDAERTTILVTNYDEGQTSFKNQALTFVMTTGEEELGKKINVYVKPDSNATSNSLKSKVIGSAIISDENVIVTDASGDKIADVADDNNMDLADNVQYAYNYGDMSTAIPKDRDGVKGIQKTLIDIDGNNKVDYVLLNEMRLGKVTMHTDAKDGQIAVAVGGKTNGNYLNDDKADIIGFENVEKDSIVLTAYIGGRLYVELAETVTGKIDAYKQSENKTDGVVNGTYSNTGFTVDGTAYDVSRVDTYTGGDLVAAFTEVDKSVISSDATFYKDQNGYVIAYGEVDEAAYKYAYVWGGEAGKTNLASDRVKVTLENGTTKTYELSTSSDINITAHDAVSGHGTQSAQTSSAKAMICEDEMSGRVFSYSITSGGEIKLYLSKNGTYTSGENNFPKFNKGLTAVKFDTALTAYSLMKPTDLKASDVNTNTTYYSNNATTFFYVTMVKGSTTEISKVSVYNGRNAAPSLDGISGSGTVALNSKGDVGAAVFTGVEVSESAGDHMFVYGANYVWDDYGYVNAFLNGKTEAVKDLKAALREGNEIVHNPSVKAGLYLYKLDGSSNYELTKPVEGDQTYYFTGVVARVNKANNTFVITDDGLATGNFKQEFQLNNDSIVIDYDANNTTPYATANGSVSVGDSVQVIVNNKDDSRVLMAAIMDRVDPSTGNGGTGPDVSWDGKTQPAGSTKVYLTGDPATDKKNILAEFAAGKNVFIEGSMDVNALSANTINIPANRALYVTGDFDGTNTPNVAGTLMVGGDLTATANVSSAKTSVLGVRGNWATGTTATINGKVTVNGNVAVDVDLTVAKDAALYAGSMDMNSNDLIVNGHVEIAGKVIDGDSITVNSATTLKVKGALETTTLIVGDGGDKTGKVELASIIATTITMNQGTLSATGAMDASALNLTGGKTIDVTVAGLTTVPTITVADAKTSLKLNGGVDGNLTVSAGNVATKAVTGDVTVSGGSMTAASVTGDVSITGGSMSATTVTGDVTVSGNVDNVNIPNVKGDLNTSGVTSGNVSVGTGKDSVVTINSEIKKNTTYSGEVKIESGAKVAAGVTLTFNGKVSGLNLLTGDDTAKIVFGSSASVSGTITTLVNNKGVAVTARNIPGTSFGWNATNSNWVATSGNAYDSTVSNTAAIDGSANLYI